MPPIRRRCELCSGHQIEPFFSMPQNENRHLEQVHFLPDFVSAYGFQNAPASRPMTVVPRHS